jgi:transposase
MLIVETIKKVRLALERGESQRSVAKKYTLSRNTVKKIASSGKTKFEYGPREKVYPILGPHIEKLEEILNSESDLPPGKRRDGKSVYEALQNMGYEGGYDAVRRYIKGWKEEHRHSVQTAYVPLVYQKGEAFQFDFSEETVEIGGVVKRVYAAQVRLCYSRMRFCRAYYRQDLPVVMDAHIRAHDAFGGLCECGIYDNPKSIVTKIGKGKERDFNQKFLQLSSHYLFEIRACTPRSGWEKGQVERQVGVNRQRVFIPRLKFDRLEELNEHLAEQMIMEGHNTRHPEFRDKTVYEVYEEEKQYLRRQGTGFDGYVVKEGSRVGSDCLVDYDNNRYSAPCEYAGKLVELKVYAGRVELSMNGKTIAVHERNFEKGRHVIEPLHYLPLLERKPGALRNGRPFVEWELPESIKQVWDSLKRYPDWDRQMSDILLSLPKYGLEALEVACSLAISANAVNRNTILNYLTRLTEEAKPENIEVEERLKLREEPRSDCGVYDSLLRGGRQC